MAVLIEVKRVRQSVTQGEAVVFINGRPVVTFGDTIMLIKPGEAYFGELIGDWASVKPDSAFIIGLLYHPLDSLYHHSDLVRAAIVEADTTQKRSVSQCGERT